MLFVTRMLYKVIRKKRRLRFLMHPNNPEVTKYRRAIERDLSQGEKNDRTMFSNIRAHTDDHRRFVH